eukprot:5414924-Amphidinium_carterae.1
MLAAHNHTVELKRAHDVYVTWNGQRDSTCVQTGARDVILAVPPWKTQGHGLACSLCGRVSPTYERLKFMGALCPSFVSSCSGVDSTEACVITRAHLKRPVKEVLCVASDTTSKKANLL